MSISSTKPASNIPKQVEPMMKTNDATFIAELEDAELQSGLLVGAVTTTRRV
jgi:hypothetical protein